MIYTSWKDYSSDIKPINSNADNTKTNNDGGSIWLKSDKNPMSALDSIVKFNSIDKLLDETKPEQPGSNAKKIDNQNKQNWTLNKNAGKVEKDQDGYKVKKGDTLAQIAKNNNMTLTQLLELNPEFKKNPNLIKVGAQVNLVGKKSDNQKLNEVYLEKGYQNDKVEKHNLSEQVLIDKAAEDVKTGVEKDTKATKNKGEGVNPERILINNIEDAAADIVKAKQNVAKKEAIKSATKQIKQQQEKGTLVLTEQEQKFITKKSEKENPIYKENKTASIKLGDSYTIPEKITKTLNLNDKQVELLAKYKHAETDNTFEKEYKEYYRKLNTDVTNGNILKEFEKQEYDKGYQEYYQNK